MALAFTNLYCVYCAIVNTLTEESLIQDILDNELHEHSNSARSLVLVGCVS